MYDHNPLKVHCLIELTSLFRENIEEDTYREAAFIKKLAYSVKQNILISGLL